MDGQTIEALKEIHTKSLLSSASFDVVKTAAAGVTKLAEELEHHVLNMIPKLS
jgi:hypothetical protein